MAIGIYSLEKTEVTSTARTRRVPGHGLAVIAYRQPITRSGIELIRGSASDRALDTLLQRGLVEHNQHHLLVTTRAFLDYANLRDLADLPPLGKAE